MNLFEYLTGSLKIIRDSFMSILDRFLQLFQIRQFQTYGISDSDILGIFQQANLFWSEIDFLSGS